MSSTPKFAHVDTSKPDGFYVQFSDKIIRDENADAPDQMGDGFWPSRDPKAAGYVGPCTDEQFAEHQEQADERMRAWRRGDWYYCGVRAVAHCLIVNNGVGTLLNLESPGVWGVESDAGEYLNELYREQVDELKAMIESMRQPTYDAAH
jgi:hypothetical protein